MPQPFWPSSSSGTPKLLSNTHGIYPKRSQIGVYDQGILCETCDGKLGVYDQHAAENLLQAVPKKLSAAGIVVGHRYDDACPVMLNCFIATVAWRASISTHSFFKRVSLGPCEDKIKKAFLENAALELGLESFIAEFNKPDASFINPHYTKFEGVRFLLIYANKYIFYVKADQRPMPSIFEQFRLQKYRPVYTCLRNWDQSKEFNIMRRMAHANPRTFSR